jgi:hypothetical protein
MRDYRVDIGAAGQGLAWLAETVARMLDTAYRDGRASKAELQQLPIRFHAIEGDSEDLDLTPLETAELRAVFERRSGEKFYFRTERDQEDEDDR